MSCCTIAECLQNHNDTVKTSEFFRRSTALFVAAAGLTGLAVMAAREGVHGLDALAVTMALLPATLPVLLIAAIANGVLVAAIFKACSTAWPTLPRSSAWRRATIGLALGTLTYISVALLFGDLARHLKFVADSNFAKVGWSEALLGLWRLQRGATWLWGVPTVVGCVVVSLTSFRALATASKV